MSHTLSTHDVSAPRRLAFWTDLVCDTSVQLQYVAPANSDAIAGEIASDELATLQLSRVTASAQFVRPTPALIARASDDHFLVSIQSQGRGVVSQDGRDALLGPGDFALYDSTRPYQLTFDGGTASGGGLQGRTDSDPAAGNRLVAALIFDGHHFWPQYGKDQPAAPMTTTGAAFS